MKFQGRIYYVGLESYQARYTLQLTSWATKTLERRGIPYTVVEGIPLAVSDANGAQIQVGQVLDAHGRTYFALSQMMQLVKLLKHGQVSGQDILFFEDMYHPGIDSLPYIFDQIPASQRPRVYVRCLAQTIDPDDFLHVHGMARWMRHYEALVNEFVSGILASSEEMIAHMRIAGWKAPIYNIAGLTFDADEVRSRVSDPKVAWSERRIDVGFAARFDQEKQPGFFLDLVERFPSLSYAIFSGGPLKSNKPGLVDRARELASSTGLRIHENLTKNEYYKLLSRTKVLFNCALQDWVSNTVSEADALGCNVLYPAYRSFPETFANDFERLYIPWSLDDASLKLMPLLKEPHPSVGRISNWTSSTMDRIIDILLGIGEEWRRDTPSYRDHVPGAKY